MNSEPPCVLLTQGEAVELRVLANADREVESSGKSTRWAPSCTETPGFLSAWADEVRTFGAGMLKGVPLDDALPPTPDPGSVAPPLYLTDSVAFLIGAAFGMASEPANKAREGLVQNVYYQGTSHEDQLGSGAFALDWHVEDACLPDRCHWVVLLCLRGAPDAVTSVSILAEMEFSEEERSLLRMVPTSLTLDASFRDQKAAGRISPILSACDDGTEEVVFDPSFTVPSSASSPLLNLFAARASKVARKFVLGAGDVLVFNNRLAVHARTAYRPRLNGDGRWLKRVLVTEVRDSRAP